MAAESHAMPRRMPTHPTNLQAASWATGLGGACPTARTAAFWSTSSVFLWEFP